MRKDDDCDDVHKLRRRFEDHLGHHREDEHQYERRQEKQDQAHAEAMTAIAKLTEAVKPLVDGISALITIQKLVKWASGFAFIGVMAAWLMDYLPVK